MENKQVYKQTIRRNCRDLKVEYIEKFYLDENNIKRYDDELLKQNKLAKTDAYKIEKGLITAKEIYEFRKANNLTQEEMANKIGIGILSIHRLEQGVIQLNATDIVIKNFIKNYKPEND